MNLLKLYWYRGEVIERLVTGDYVWSGQAIGSDIALIYKTIEDAKNAIRKFLDGTHKREPRRIGLYVWIPEKQDWKPYYSGKVEQ